MSLPDWMRENLRKPVKQPEARPDLGFPVEDDLQALRIGEPEQAELLGYDPANRRTFIGGSDIAAVLGLSAWRTPLDVFFAKTAGEAPITDPEHMKRLNRGKRLEPIVLQMLQDEHPRVLVTARNKRYQDADVPYFASEIDFEWLGRFGNGADELVATQPQNGEIKTVHPFAAREWGEADSEDVPIEYSAQAMWNLGVTRREFTLVSALFGADNLVHYRVLADPETIEGMRAKATAFWQNHVLTGKPPPPTNLADVGKLWPVDGGTTIEATPEIAAAAATFFALRDRARTIEDGKDGVELLIAEYMKDATWLTYQGAIVCSRKVSQRESIKVKDLRAIAPEVADQIVKSTEYRVIRKKAERKR